MRKHKLLIQKQKMVMAKRAGMNPSKVEAQMVNQSSLLQNPPQVLLNQLSMTFQITASFTS
jgi:hypothetical protein